MGPRGAFRAAARGAAGGSRGGLGAVDRSFRCRIGIARAGIASRCGEARRRVRGRAASGDGDPADDADRPVHRRHSERAARWRGGPRDDPRSRSSADPLSGRGGPHGDRPRAAKPQASFRFRLEWARPRQRRGHRHDRRCRRRPAAALPGDRHGRTPRRASARLARRAAGPVPGRCGNEVPAGFVPGRRHCHRRDGAAATDAARDSATRTEERLPLSPSAPAP